MQCSLYISVSVALFHMHVHLLFQSSSFLTFSDATPANGIIPGHLLPQASSNVSTDQKEKESEDDTTEISRLLGSKQIHTHRCLKCGRQVSKESVMLLCNLVYPEAKEGNRSCMPLRLFVSIPHFPDFLITLCCNGLAGVQYTFGQVLGKSLCPEQVTPAWCDSCDRFQPTKQSRGLKQLPYILSINCGLDNAKVYVAYMN